MSGRRTFRLSSPALRDWVASFIKTAPIGTYVDVGPEPRTDPQNKRLHAMIREAVKKGFQMDGRRFTEDDAKTLFVSGWMKRTTFCISCNDPCVAGCVSRGVG